VRFLYNLLTYVLFLPHALYWLARALGNKSYGYKLGQRFGFSYPQLDRCIWIHAVSVGEVVAAAPLVRVLRRQSPKLPLLVTTVTPTGAARVAALFGKDVHHGYIPFEMPIAVNAFFASVRPLSVCVSVCGFQCECLYLSLSVCGFQCECLYLSLCCVSVFSSSL